MYKVVDTNELNIEEVFASNVFGLREWLRS